VVLYAVSDWLLFLMCGSALCEPGKFNTQFGRVDCDAVRMRARLSAWLLRCSLCAGTLERHSRGPSPI
jgi:hypothetical protein